MKISIIEPVKLPNKGMLRRGGNHLTYREQDDDTHESCYINPGSLISHKYNIDNITPNEVFLLVEFIPLPVKSKIKDPFYCNVKVASEYGIKTIELICVQDINIISDDRSVG